MPLACLIDWTVRLSDIIGWVVMAALAVIVYLLFQKHQIRITRHSIVRQLEEDAATLLSAKTALEEKTHPPNSTLSSEPREFRAVLDNIPPWVFEEDLTVPPIVSGWPSAKYKFINGQSFCLIRAITKPDKTRVSQYLAPRALQETLLWFRRIERARRNKVITENELLDLWRFILPLAFAGRTSYFAKYFQGPEDIRSMVQVINATLRAALQLNQRRPLHYFNSYVTEPDLNILTFDKEALRLHQKVKRVRKQ